jgi:hypothetical protein
MVKGVVKFAVLVNAPIPRRQETFEPIIQREARKRIDGDFHERWWDRVFAFVLKTYKDPENLKGFLKLSMCRLQSLVAILATRAISPSNWAMLSVAEFHRTCFQRLGMSGSVLEGVEPTKFFERSWMMYNELMITGDDEAEERGDHNDGVSRGLAELKGTVGKRLPCRRLMCLDCEEFYALRARSRPASASRSSRMSPS